MGLLGGEIISECTAAIDPTIVKNSEGLIDNKTAYLFAFRTNKEYQGKGYFEKKNRSNDPGKPAVRSNHEL